MASQFEAVVNAPDFAADLAWLNVPRPLSTDTHAVRVAASTAAQ